MVDHFNMRQRGLTVSWQFARLLSEKKNKCRALQDRIIQLEQEVGYYQHNKHLTHLLQHKLLGISCRSFCGNVSLSRLAIPLLDAIVYSRHASDAFSLLMAARVCRRHYIGALAQFA